jgi:hypothetical protein
MPFPPFMERPERNLLLPANEIFSDFDRDNRHLHTVASSEASECCASRSSEDDWRLFVARCEAMLKAAKFQPTSKSLEIVAVQIAQMNNRSYHIGVTAGAREAAIIRAGAARTAKQRKTDQRGRIVRRAIIAVCAQQKITLAASAKFAVSIRAEVIDAARRLGLTDAKSGTSSRSIQRHIAALLKHERMQYAISDTLPNCASLDCVPSDHPGKDRA